MVDEEQEQDEFAFIFEGCRKSSSQEELLTHDKIAREDEESSDDDYTPEMVDSGEVFRKLDGIDEFWDMIDDEFVADDAELEELENLGFREEQKGEISGTKLEGFCDEEREIEHELKKCEVSPVVVCGEKVVIEGEDDGEEIGMFEGDLEVEKASALRSGDRGSGDCGENSGSEGGGDDVDMEGDITEGGGSKRKLDFGVIDFEEEEEDDVRKKQLEFSVENEAIIVEDDGERGDVCKERDSGEGSASTEGDRKQGNDTSSSSPREEKRRKRELPRSLFGSVWGEGSGGRDRVVGNRNKEEEEAEEEVLYGEGNGDANRNVEEKEEEEVLCVEGNGDVNRNVDEEEEEVLCGERNGEVNRNVEEVLCGERNGEANRNVEEKEEEEVACGEGSGDANRNEVIRNDHVENGLEEASAERNRDGIFRACEEGKMRSILDVLRFLAKEKNINDGGGKVNLVETVKRCGITFPRSRFSPEEVKDDDDDDDEEDV